MLLQVGHRRWVLLIVASGLALASACGAEGEQDSAVIAPRGSADARAVVETLRTRFRFAGSSVPVLRDAVAVGFDHEDGWIRARFASGAKTERPARVALPVRASAPFSIEDEASGVSMHVTLEDALDAPAETADGYIVYRNAHASGADVVHRVTAEGTEDFVAFERAPITPAVRYGIALGEGVAGLRLVGNTLELLDGDGAPRLRVTSPYLVDRHGTRHEATLAVEGCAVDTDPTAPHGRAVVEPGAEQCTVRVRWNGEEVAYPALLDPAWITTGSMVSARTDHASSMLADGRVLVVGGSSGNPSYPLSSAELYDPASGTWSATLPMLLARQGTTATTLADGRVLVAAGYEYNYLTDCVLYDPASGTWSTTGAMAQPRSAHRSTLLSDGRVLVVGGFGPPTGELASAEIYDPVSGTWSTTQAMSIGRRGNTATLLVDGRVLVTGGYFGSFGTVASAELYDVTSGAWNPTASMTVARVGHSATLLPDGRVLVAGGSNGNTTVVSVELYDAALGTWTPTYPMNVPRFSHTATLLPDGRLLVVGGGSNLAAAELRDPTTHFWSATASLVIGRSYHTANLLADGRVLVAGGSDFFANGLASAELFDEAPLGMSCSSAAQCTSGYCVDGVCCENDCAGGVEDCLHCGTGYCETQDGVLCDDGDACTQVDICLADVCTGSDSVECTALDECHQAGTCDPTSGVCSDPSQPNGTVCTNGTCEDGACVDAGAGGAGDGGDPGMGGFPGVGGSSVLAVASFEPEESGCGIARQPRSSTAWWLAPLVLIARRRRRQRLTHSSGGVPSHAGS